jgi:outer membrane protein OmpA-like peptidoglycan-associated protein
MAMRDTQDGLAPTVLTSHQEAQWISLSDLITGLMMLFMLIAIAFMLKVQAEEAEAKHVAEQYIEIRQELYRDLYTEFKDDLPIWNAALTKDLILTFRGPEVLFDTGKADLKPRFRQILQDFFPRYVKIITSLKYKSSIQEIRIEGHTSSDWNGATGTEEAYFQNMELSQDRTRSTLRFVLKLPDVQKDIGWLRGTVTANGLSSSHLIFKPDGITEDADRSKRVEFRILTDADAKIEKILVTVR